MFYQCKYSQTLSMALNGHDFVLSGSLGDWKRLLSRVHISTQWNARAAPCVFLACRKSVHQSWIWVHSSKPNPTKPMRTVPLEYTCSELSDLVCCDVCSQLVSRSWRWHAVLCAWLNSLWCTWVELFWLVQFSSVNVMWTSFYASKPKILYEIVLQNGRKISSLARDLIITIVCITDETRLTH